MQRGTRGTEERRTNALATPVDGATASTASAIAPAVASAVASAELLDWRAAAALAARVAAGDDRALAALYDAYAPMLLTVALRVVHEQTDAEEVVLDAFTQAWRDAGRYDPSRGSVFAWLVTICRTRALDLVRGRARAARMLERATNSADADGPPALAAWRPDPAADYDRNDRYDRLTAAVESLPPVIRQVVELVLTESLTHTELAERLGIPLGTVKTRMRTGLRLLRDALGATFLDDRTHA